MFNIIISIGETRSLSTSRTFMGNWKNNYCEFLINIKTEKTDNFGFSLYM